MGLVLGQRGAITRSHTFGTMEPGKGVNYTRRLLDVCFGNTGTLL